MSYSLNVAQVGREPSVCSFVLQLTSSLLSLYIVCLLQSVSMVLLCCRCVYGAAGAAGWHAAQRGREGVMANIRGKEPLTHGTSNVGLWKIHLNTHTA